MQTEAPVLLSFLSLRSPDPSVHTHVPTRTLRAAFLWTGARVLQADQRWERRRWRLWRLLPVAQVTQLTSSLEHFKRERQGRLNWRHRTSAPGGTRDSTGLQLAVSGPCPTCNKKCIYVGGKPRSDAVNCLCSPFLCVSWCLRRLGEKWTFSHMKKPICFKFEQKFRNINDSAKSGEEANLDSMGFCNGRAG